MIWQKRTKPRAGLPARATIWADGRRLGAFPPLHLHEGGMLLEGKAPAAAGEVVALELEFTDGRTASVAGLVAPQEYPGEAELFALVFVGLTDEARAVVRGSIEEGIEAASTATALVVDDSPEICAALRRELHRLGHTVVAVDRIDAATRLLEQGNRISVALVDLFLITDDGRELLGYLAGHHPDVRRVLMSGELALSRVPDPDQTAHALLIKPWTRAALAEVLQNAPTKRAA